MQGEAGRVDTVFKVGDRMLLWTKQAQLEVEEIGKLQPQSDGPYGSLAVTACPSPNAYTLALPCRMRCSPTVKADRKRPRFTRDHLDSCQPMISS